MKTLTPTDDCREVLTGANPHGDAALIDDIIHDRAAERRLEVAVSNMAAAMKADDVMAAVPQ